MVSDKDSNLTAVPPPPTSKQAQSHRITPKPPARRSPASGEHKAALTLGAVGGIDLAKFANAKLPMPRQVRCVG